MNILYEVGAYGPILLALLTWYLLWNRKTLFYYYTVGVVLNSILNIILKMLIQEPRPSVDAQQLELLKRHAHDYFFQNGIPFNCLVCHPDMSNPPFFQRFSSIYLFERING